MTVKEFAIWVQGYYGAYPDGQKADVAAYLRDLSPEYLVSLKATLLKRYSSKWGHAPDIAIFEENRREATDGVRYDSPALEDNRPLATSEELSAFAVIFGETMKKISEKVRGKV